jgi:hypothetical protein
VYHFDDYLHVALRAMLFLIYHEIKWIISIKEISLPSLSPMKFSDLLYANTYSEDKVVAVMEIIGSDYRLRPL